ncbi:MAG: ABC transporter ATP-binding protein [Hyphomicrobiaceae bacterium]
MTHEAAPDAMLTVQDLAAWYGEAQALFDIGFRVGPGEAVVLLGRNGAGKSTVLKSLMAIEARRRGRITFAGADLSRWATHRIARAGLGYVAEDRRIFSGLTVAENLAVAELPPRDGLEPWDLAAIWRLFPPLERIAERRAGHLSGGEQQMLAISRTLMGNPRFLLLDEPTEGLAPVILDRIADTLLGLKARGLGMLVAEQNLAYVGSFADRALILETGHLRYDGSIHDLEAQPDVVRRHLAL